jgi:hypothetical protein
MWLGPLGVQTGPQTRSRRGREALLRLLDCGEAPRTWADRAHERPELLELDGFRAAAVDELPGLVGGVCDGKPWPDGFKTAKIHYIAKKSAEAPFNVAGRTAATLTPTLIFGTVSAASSSAARTMPGTRDGQHPVRTLTLRLPS